MKKRTKFKYYKAYKKERTRVLRNIRELKKLGLAVDVKIPAIPKRITEASVNRLKKISNAYIKKHTSFIDLDTGEIIGYNTFRVRGYTIKELKNVSRVTFLDHRPIFPDSPIADIPILDLPPIWEQAVLDDWLNTISDYNSIASEIFMQWTTSMLEELGLTEFCELLEEGRKAGAWLTRSEAYDNERVKSSLATLMSFADLNQNESAVIIQELEKENSFFSEFYDYEYMDY